MQQLASEFVDVYLALFKMAKMIFAGILLSIGTSGLAMILENLYYNFKKSLKDE